MSLSDGLLGWMIRPILYLLIAYGVFVILLYLYQDKLIFLPTYTLTSTPKDAGLDYEEVYFITQDKLTLHGWFIPSDKSSLVILFSHGNGGNISHRIEKIKMLNTIGLSVFIYDYRGYGKSTGKPTEQGTYLDALAAWDYLINTIGIKANQIILYGESLGSAVSIDLATKVPAFAIINEGGFTSLKELAQHVYPYLPARYLCKYEYDSLKKISGLKRPNLIIHSIDDEIVPFAMAKRLFDNATEPKVLISLSGGHNDSFYVSRKEYLQGIKDFLDMINRT
ncbi:MAG: alpha/beta hydrolase [Thermodesulfovibrionales bacterium]|nr:alpha/beta hydrolase [Thermodesulfovibrionales bacterium]